MLVQAQLGVISSVYWSPIKSYAALIVQNIFINTSEPLSLAYHLGPVQPSRADGSPFSKLRLSLGSKKWAQPTSRWNLPNDHVQRRSELNCSTKTHDLLGILMEQLREKNVACFSDNKLSHLSRRKKSLEGEKRNVLGRLLKFNLTGA